MLYCPLLLSAPNQSAKCDFSVDTGAEVSTLRSSYVKKWFPEEPLRPSDLKLGGFDAQHVIQPDGALPLQAQFLGQAPGVVTFQVVPDTSQAVLGLRDLELLGILTRQTTRGSGNGSRQGSQKRQLDTDSLLEDAEPAQPSHQNGEASGSQGILELRSSRARAADELPRQDLSGGSGGTDV